MSNFVNSGAREDSFRKARTMEIEEMPAQALGAGLNGGRTRYVKSRASVFLRVMILIAIYSLVLMAAHCFAYLLRFEFRSPSDEEGRFRQASMWILPSELLLLYAFGQFRSLLSYFSLPDARKIAYAATLVAAGSLAIWYGSNGQKAPPRSIIVLSAILDIMGLCGARLVFRLVREQTRNATAKDGLIRKVVIIGAGDVGANLVKEMRARRDLGMLPVGLFDDDQRKWGAKIHGIPVLGAPDIHLSRKVGAQEAIIAMPSATGKRMREIVQQFTSAGIKCETVPSVEQMVNGEVKVSQIRAVEIEDLLGRAKIEIEDDSIKGIIEGKIVMVTGAGGSIGSELCRQILKYKPLRLLIIERCEVQMFKIEQELLANESKVHLIPLVADVLDTGRVKRIFEIHRPSVVFHAAAHKHVPLMESQPYEALRNNALGTAQLASLSAQNGVERFVLISTDKAINPTNAMGASKRIAELFLQAIQAQHGHKTRFMAVRFGNVLGSSGSVIPTFKKQIASGGPVTVTHPEVTRYFMTVQEAVGLVLQSSTQGEGGEIFVLDMGKLVRIVDVARQLIELSGLRPDIDIEIKYVGLRPGEKLFEEINHRSELMVPTKHPKILRFTGPRISFEELEGELERLAQSALEMDGDQLKRELRKIVPEYQPYLATQ
jgi:FlaA1/EpsC-like NDP-sugar epimerase